MSDIDTNQDIVEAMYVERETTIALRTAMTALSSAQIPSLRGAMAAIAREHELSMARTRQLVHRIEQAMGGAGAEAETPGNVPCHCGARNGTDGVPWSCGRGDCDWIAEMLSAPTDPTGDTQ